MRYEDDVIEEVREKMISWTLFPIRFPEKKGAPPTLDFALFIMKNRLPFLSVGKSRCIIASAADREEMCTHF